MRDPFTAGILSFLIPGVGQLYNGRILAGILWLIITPGRWIGSGVTELNFLKEATGVNPPSQPRADLSNPTSSGYLEIA